MKGLFNEAQARKEDQETSPGREGMTWMGEKKGGT